LGVKLLKSQPSSQLRALPRGRVLGCDPHEIRRPASIAVASPRARCGGLLDVADHGPSIVGVRTLEALIFSRHP